MKKLFVFSLLMAQLCAKGQHVNFVSDEFSGVQKNINGRDHYIKLDGDNFLYAGSKLYDDEVTLYKLDKNCKTLWNIPEVKGFLYASKLNNNILVFTESYDKSYIANSIHVQLLSSDKGQVIAQKNIPVVSGNQRTIFYLLSDSDKNFRYLLMRTTQQKGSSKYVNFKDEKTEGYTDKLEALSLNDKLDIKTTDLNVQPFQQAAFISSICNEQSDIFISYLQNNTISVSRYNAGEPNIAATVSAKTNFDKDVAIFSTGFTRLQQNTVILSCTFDEEKETWNTLVTGTFDFDNNKAVVTQDLIDKSYIKQYTESYDAGLGNVYTIGMMIYKDKIIVIKEGQTPKYTMNKDDIYYVYQPLIIDVYDFNMKKIKELIVDENEYVFPSFSNAGYKILNNSLYLFYTQNKGIGLQPKYRIINLDNMVVGKEVEFEMDRKINSALYGPGIVWLDNATLVPFLSKDNLFSGKKYSTVFRSVDFK